MMRDGEPASGGRLNRAGRRRWMDEDEEEDDDIFDEVEPEKTPAAVKTPAVAEKNNDAKPSRLRDLFRAGEEIEEDPDSATEPEEPVGELFENVSADTPEKIQTPANAAVVPASAAASAVVSASVIAAL